MAVMDVETGKLLNYRKLMRHPKHKKGWQIYSANEIGRLTNGIGGCIKGTNTIKFIHKVEMPKEWQRDVTYGQFVCNVHPEKAKQNRIRFTVGGKHIN